MQLHSFIRRYIHTYRPCSCAFVHPYTRQECRNTFRERQIHAHGTYMYLPIDGLLRPCPATKAQEHTKSTFTHLCYILHALAVWQFICFGIYEQRKGRSNRVLLRAVGHPCQRSAGTAFAAYQADGLRVQAVLKATVLKDVASRFVGI